MAEKPRSKSASPKSSKEGGTTTKVSSSKPKEVSPSKPKEAGSSSGITVYYAHPGAAEAVIHSLKIGCIEFKESQIDRNELQKKYGSKGVAMVVGGRAYTKDIPCLRYIGKLKNNWGYPKDAFTAAIVDDLLEEIKKIKGDILGAEHLGDKAAVIDRRQQIQDEGLSEFLEKIETKVSKVGKGTVFADGPGILDCEVAALVSWLLKGNITGISKDILGDFNNVSRVHYELMRHDKIRRNQAKTKAGDA